MQPSTPNPVPERHTFRLLSEFHYLLHNPENPGPGGLAFIALHGYGFTPQVMLSLTAAAVGSGWPIASLQAPNQFFRSQAGNGEPGYNWGVGAHAAANIALHHEMVSFVAAELQARYGVPPARCVLVGYSQPVALNYRFIATHAGRVGGVVAVCGGVPHDWETGTFLPAVDVPVLHISRDADEFYPLEKINQFPARLRMRIADLEFHLMPGGHRFPSKGGPVIREWLARKFQVTA